MRTRAMQRIAMRVRQIPVKPKLNAVHPERLYQRGIHQENNYKKANKQQYGKQ
jgi:hypothetical protein